MKTYEIINEYSKKKELAYILYYKKSDTYIIEINRECDENDLPLLLSEFYRKGVYTLSPEWSKRFIETRIIPRDRQNLSDILDRYNLKEYNTSKLLELSKGRCAQDECAIQLNPKCPDWLTERQKDNIREAVVLPNDVVILECENNEYLFVENKSLNNKKIDIIPGGYGISINESLNIMKDDLFKDAIEYELTPEDIRLFNEETIVSTSDAAKMLNCSRQYVNALVNANKLNVYKKFDNVQIFLRSDIIKLLW